MNIDPEILSGKKCPYCGHESHFTDSSVVYGRSYGNIYICHPCNAYVGVHKGTNRALGRLADKELREAKKKAHFYFDQIAKTSLINKIWSVYIHGISNRKKAYRWLANEMNIEEQYCHIGMFDIQECEQVVEICRYYLENRTPEQHL